MSNDYKIEYSYGIGNCVKTGLDFITAKMMAKNIHANGGVCVVVDMRKDELVETEKKGG